MEFEEKQKIYAQFTFRQKEIMKQLLKGTTQKDIIVEINGKIFSLQTIKKDIKIIYKIFGITGGQIQLMSECYDWYPIIYHTENLPCKHCFRSPEYTHLIANDEK